MLTMIILAPICIVLGLLLLVVAYYAFVYVVLPLGAIVAIVWVVSMAHSTPTTTPTTTPAHDSGPSAPAAMVSVVPHTPTTPPKLSPKRHAPKTRVVYCDTHDDCE